MLKDDRPLPQNSPTPKTTLKLIKLTGFISFNFPLPPFPLYSYRSIVLCVGEKGWRGSGVGGGGDEIQTLVPRCQLLCPDWSA